jgi:hypothetical protein
MKRIATLLMLSFLAVGAFAQVAFSGVSWIAWDTEPAYDGIVGYADNPYDNPLVVIPQAPEGVSPGLIVDAATFDIAWGLLGDAHYMDKIIQDPANGDPYDLVDGVGTFGASWKGVHDGSNLYIFSKYVDTNAQLDAGTHNYEVMVQPTSYFRHEPTFAAAADSAAEWDTVYHNMAYGRYVELGGGKAVFKDGVVSEYAASIGLQKSTFWKGFAVGAWGGNDHGLEGLAMATHFWDVTDGVIRSILVMSFDGALGYPADPTDLSGDYIPVKVGDTISFDIKSRGAIAGNSVEYHWASDHNNCYGSIYYAGHLVLAAPPAEPGDVALAGVSWIAWDTEPAYDGVVGYADNPYDNLTADILMAPDGWSYAGITDAATFDATWDILGDSMVMDKIIQDPANGDPYDLDGDATFGAAWKGVHDGSNFYVFTKYWDTNAQLDAGSHNYEVMVQPTSYIRHEHTFEAASDSAAQWDTVYHNMAYGRYVELGGGKAVFKDGVVSEYAASIGLNKSTFWKGFAVGAWGGNDHGLEGLAMATHFWDVTDGVIRAVMVMSFDGALGYPADIEDLSGDYTPVHVGETISFDIKSRGTIAGNSVEYHWSSDHNNCYGSIYYAGHVTLSDEQIVIGGVKERTASSVKVFVTNDMLNIRGIESADMKIYSITGSLVRSVRNVSGQLDISDMADGVYFIKIEGVPSGFKVVK